ncbi:cupin domain-containing protein [Maridesulfovibrio sp.]|uniref:cupin domain-containing protein n=1 Tax=Maridesulfovibrio sp. TaxID=2795000 RepID=UPI0029CA6EFB|nr:cupin domain-containing protein [Maridesulfovibrio sp.]
MTDTLKDIKAASEYITPPGHVLFSALRLAGRIDDQIADCSVADIAPGGGGPNPHHTHEHDHLFVVLAGCVEVKIDEDTIRLSPYESLLVPGNKLHSVWNTSEAHAKVLGISLNRGSEF